MVDSNDRERVNEAREELMRMLAEDELRDAVLLVFANKQVRPYAYTCTVHMNTRLNGLLWRMSPQNLTSLTSGSNYSSVLKRYPVSLSGVV